MLNFEKQETKGRTEMLALFDAGTFVETGALKLHYIHHHSTYL